MPRPTATVSVVGKGDVKASVAVNINGDEVVNSALPPMQQPASAVITVVGDGDVHASVHVELDGGDVSVQTTSDDEVQVTATPTDEISRNESNHMVMRVAGISRPLTTP